MATMLPRTPGPLDVLASQGPALVDKIAEQRRNRILQERRNAEFDKIMRIFDEGDSADSSGQVFTVNPNTQIATEAPQQTANQVRTINPQAVFSGQQTTPSPTVRRPNIGIDPNTGSPFVSGIKEVENPKFKQFQENKKQIADRKKESRDTGLKLGKEFRGSKGFKDFQEIKRAAGNIQAAFDRSTNPKTKDKLAVDQALVVSFNKLLDPGSVVRESEFARTPQGQALVRAYQGRALQLFQGGVGLTEEGRQEIMVMAQDLLGKSSESIQKDINVFRNLAQSFEVDPDLVLGGIEDEFDLLGGGAPSVGVEDDLDIQTPEIEEPETSANVVIMQDSKGNRAEVEVDKNGTPIRVLREL